MAKAAKKNQTSSGVTDVVERIGGQRPESLENFVRANRMQFTEEGVESHA